MFDEPLRIGAGTGIFTRALLAHPDWSGSIKQLRAIEPVEGMREQFSKTVIDERVTIAEGAFDRTGVEDGWADLVVIAQVKSPFVSKKKPRDLLIYGFIGFPLVSRL